MTDKERFKFNIQLFRGAEGGDTGGEPTPNPEPIVNTGAGGEPMSALTEDENGEWKVIYYTELEQQADETEEILGDLYMYGI